MSSNSSGGFLRSCLIVFGIFFVICIIGFIGLVVCVGTVAGAIGNSAALNSSTAEYTTEFISGNKGADKRIAVIDVKGTIASEGEAFGEVIANSKQIVKLIRAAKDDESVKAIIVDLDTPGGEVTASDEIYHELKLCGKPVVAMMNTMAASGGYYVACGANKIVANKFTMTGSIGQGQARVLHFRQDEDHAQSRQAHHRRGSQGRPGARHGRLQGIRRDRLRSQKHPA